MSARDRLLDRNDPEWNDTVDEILAEHRDEVLREAAEKIRAAVQSFKDYGVLEPDKDWAASSAANFIDPDVLDEY